MVKTKPLSLDNVTAHACVLLLPFSLKEDIENIQTLSGKKSVGSGLPFSSDSADSDELSESLPRFSDDSLEKKDKSLYQ